MATGKPNPTPVAGTLTATPWTPVLEMFTVSRCADIDDAPLVPQPIAVALGDAVVVDVEVVVVPVGVAVGVAVAQ